MSSQYPARFKTEGLILRVTRFQESDRFVRILVPSGEVLELLARSVGKSVKRFGGGLEPLSLQLFEVSHRRATFVAEQAQHVHDYLALRLALPRFYLASYAAERALQIAPCEGLFELVRAVLDLLVSSDADILAAKTAFDLRLLSIAGFAPQLEDCTVCGTALGNRAACLDASGDGFACPEHAEPRAPASPPGLRMLLRALAETELSHLARIALSPAQRVPVRRTVQHFLDSHLRGPIRSQKLLQAYLG